MEIETELVLYRRCLQEVKAVIDYIGWGLVLWLVFCFSACIFLLMLTACGRTLTEPVDNEPVIAFSQAVIHPSDPVSPAYLPLAQSAWRLMPDQDQVRRRKIKKIGGPRLGDSTQSFSISPLYQEGCPGLPGRGVSSALPGAGDLK